MKSEFACLPCALMQGLRAANAGRADRAAPVEAYCAVMKALEKFDLERSPAANATDAVKAACRAVANEDPYRNVRREQNRLALGFASRAARVIEESRDGVETALLLSCLGNAIDLGAQECFDLENELKNTVESGFARSDIEDFRRELGRARSVMLVADNAGEIVFDRSLLEVFPAGVRKAVAVKSGPIINDATVEDALMVGLDTVARVIPTGSGDLGVDRDACSEEFKRELAAADLVIAKGHANFETMNEEKMGVFFLLKAKCEVVARALNVKTGSLVMVRE